MRVLLAQSHDPSRAQLRELLESRGHDVVEATTVPAAEAALRGEAFDLVLSDVALREGGGEALLRRVRAALPSPPPFVALSVYEFRSERDRLSAAGFASILKRGSDPRQLGAEIERHRPAA